MGIISLEEDSNIRVADVFLEKKLVILTFVFQKLDRIPQAKQILEGYKNETLNLTEFTNPFKELKQDYPATSDFIDLAIAQAKLDDNFSASYYEPMVKARKRVKGLLAKNNSHRFVLNTTTRQVEKYDKRFLR